MTQIIPMNRQYVKEIAAEYRKKGHEVIEYPTPEQLPDFMDGFTPELLVRIGDYTKVVEVMGGHPHSRDRRPGDLARLLADKPDWGHELALIGKMEGLQLPEDALSFDRDHILQNIETANELLKSGFHREALLTAWAALEATVRIRNKLEGIPPDHLSAPAILSQAVYYGAISTNDHTALNELRKYRNAVAHGFKLDGFDPVIVRKLNRMVKRLLPSVKAMEQFARRGPYKQPD